MSEKRHKEPEVDSKSRSAKVREDLINERLDCEQELFAISSHPLHFIEPSLEGENNESQYHAYELAAASQNTYLAASGTLTQFNAIMAAIHSTAMSGSQGTLKVAFAGALLLHVLAAFLLCWAARPVANERPTSKSMAFANTQNLTSDTFKNYRRGWRVTMIALMTSGLALGLVALRHADGQTALFWGKQELEKASHNEDFRLPAEQSIDEWFQNHWPGTAR